MNRAYESVFVKLSCMPFLLSSPFMIKRIPYFLIQVIHGIQMQGAYLARLDSDSVNCVSCACVVVVVVVW